MIARIRNLYLRRYFKLLGCTVDGHLAVSGLLPRVRCDGTLALGDGVSLMCNQGPRIVLWAHPDATLAIGRGSFINQSATIIASVEIRIGANAKIGPHVVMHDTSYHEVDQGAGTMKAPILIGDNVWIGRGATILPGVSIGSHSVIGAGSIVTKSVPDRTVVAGNPARIIREVRCDDNYVRP